EGRKLIDQQQEAVPVSFLLGALEHHLFGQAVDCHREHQADEGAQPNLVTGRHDQIQGYWPRMVHQVVDGEVARRRILCNQWVAVEGPCVFAVESTPPKSRSSLSSISCTFSRTTG